MDPRGFHAKKLDPENGRIGSTRLSHRRNWIQLDPVGVSIQEEKTFGLGMQSLASLLPQIDAAAYRGGMEGVGGGDAVRNSTSAGRKIFLLSPDATDDDGDDEVMA